VTVIANGKQEIVSVKIDSEVVDPNDIEMLQDLIQAAVNDALRKAQEMIASEMNKITGVVSAIDVVLKYSIFPMKRPGGHNIRGRKSSPGKPRDLVSLPIVNETTTDVVTASPGDRVKKIISLMEEEKISDVIIADDFNEPAGIITIKDLLKLFF